MLIRFYSGIVFNPIFITIVRLRETLESIIKPLVTNGVSCLDVGCGERPYEYLFKDGKYTGIDIESSGRPSNMKQPDFYYNGRDFPFKDDQFDMVICTQVLEHVPEPLSLLKEMARVCKRGGGVIISLPFVYQEHEQPFDYFRFTRFGITELLEKAGMKVELMKRDSSAIETLAILTNAYIVTNLVPNIRGIWRLYSIILCFPISLIALILSKLLPDKGHLYLNLVVHARKI
jgi:ubiquinone/menaquinone biosynthesis C-methylase UbiE